MAAAIAGDHGIPTVSVSGDDKVTAEVAEKIPKIEPVVVKKALSAYQAQSLIPQRACERIGDGVRAALARFKEIPPYVIRGPVRLNLLDSPTHAPPLMALLEEDVVAATINDAFLEFERQMPWIKFNVVLPDGFIYP